MGDEPEVQVEFCLKLQDMGNFLLLIKKIPKCIGKTFQTP